MLVVEVLGVLVFAVGLLTAMLVWLQAVMDARERVWDAEWLAEIGVENPWVGAAHHRAVGNGDGGPLGQRETGTTGPARPVKAARDFAKADASSVEEASPTTEVGHPLDSPDNRDRDVPDPRWFWPSGRGPWA